MTRRSRTMWGGLGLLTVAAGLALAVDAMWGTFGLLRWWSGDAKSNPVRPIPVLKELNVPDLCRAYWTTIKRGGSEPKSEGESNGAAGSSTVAAISAASAETVDFDRDVRPILVEHCYACHGPEKQEGGVRFDRAASWLSETESGQAPVVPGDAGASSLITRVTSDDEHLRMPAEGDPLSTEQIALLRDWVVQGATSPDELRHWAFVRPQRPLLPPVNRRQWPRNPIDHFVLARLESEGLSPSPEADPTTLIRRLFLDLTGLPPSSEEVDRFVRDRSADAYEKLVDRVLASPHYGERWAVRWLDLARYADTNGFGYDANRDIWLYRDWVIHALNTDKPFDVFTVEQLAGDLLPNSTDGQKVATGFVRSSAVQADLEQQRYEVMVDRVNTVGTVWLGLSVGCAQCHDHKFDPLSQREYFQLYAIFNNGAVEVKEGRLIEASFGTASPITDKSGTTLIMEDAEKRNATRMKIRGGFRNDGDEVEPGVPGSFHPPACGAGDRLGLACWIVDPDNPLTARVTVNRFWESLFGRGLVLTSEDLGTRSEPPSHPELLDWLATEFQRNDWSMKRLLRLLVTSATYRQSSHMSPALRDRDPQNRLLARGPRVRVDAEFVRDIALAASGALSDHMGGPSVFPPQPRGISEDRLFGSFRWKTSREEPRYRRGLYTFWKRSAMYPSFALFDAPSRTATCPRRMRSTTPLQALVTLNDPAFFEAAILFGRRMMSFAGGSVGERAAYGFRLCLARRPTDDELDRLLVYYEEELQRWKQDPDSARRLVGGGPEVEDHADLNVPQWAAWTMLANVLLNLDETITKD